jgi:transcriptional regulator with XRE-family HTH domain
MPVAFALLDVGLSGLTDVTGPPGRPGRGDPIDIRCSDRDARPGSPAPTSKRRDCAVNLAADVPGVTNVASWPLAIASSSGDNGVVIAERPKEQAKRAGATIGEFIREQREQGQVSMRQLARLAGVSNPYLSQIERGLRKPSAEILQQIAKGLRISAEQLYIRAGILDARDGDPELVSAILADDGLGERQKQVLIDIYESFRREKVQRLASAAPAASAAIPAAMPADGSTSAVGHGNQTHPKQQGK